MHASSILAVAFATLAAAQVVMPGSDCGSLAPQYQAACSASRAAATATTTIPLIGSDCASLPPQYQAACYASRSITPTPAPTNSCDAQRTACNTAPGANHAQCAALYYQCMNPTPYSNATTVTTPCYTTTITTVTCNAAGCLPCTLTTTVPIVPVTTITPCANCVPVVTTIPVVPTTAVTVPVVPVTTTTAARPVFTGAASAQQVSGALLVGAGLIAALL